MGWVQAREQVGRLAGHFDASRLAGHFDASRLTVADASAVLEHAAAIEKMAAAVKAEAAARVASSGSWLRTGHRSPAHQLARLSGTTVGQAHQVLATAERVAALPEVAAAAKAGELSAAQAATVAEAAVLAPAATGALLAAARGSSLAELAETARRVTAAADADAEARRFRIHAGRYLRHWTNVDGAGHLRLRENPEVIAAVLAACAPARAELARAAQAEGRSERADALDADALVATVTGADAATPAAPRRIPPAKVLVRVDFDTLLRGWPIAGEVCEVVGYGPVAVSAVAEMLAAGGFLAAVVARGEAVTGVAHLGRRSTAAQRSALEWLHPTCAAEGCTRSVALEVDHQVPWAKSRVTLLEWLDRFCGHEHDLKTHHGWALVPGVGKRAFVPPEDPRHPRHQQANAPPESPAA